MNRSVLVLSLFLVGSSSAWANFPKITHIRPFDPLIAGQRSVTEAFLDGSGFFPAVGSAAALETTAELNYRKIAPTLGTWQTALWHAGSRPTDDNSPIEITSIGDNQIRIAMFESQVMHPGAWAFSYCIATIGCSESFVVTIQDPSALLDLNTRFIDEPVLAGNNHAIMDLALGGLVTLDPQLIWTFSTATNPAIISGSGFPAEGRARFFVGADVLRTPGIFTISVYDKVLGINSSTAMVRVFGNPLLKSVPAPIIENLSAFQAIQDASVKLQFAPFTVPSEVDITDSNGANHVVNPPIDVLSNSVDLKIPAAWLKVGTSKLVLNFKNISGEGLLYYLPATINKPEVHPIPGPHPTLPPVIMPPVHP